MPRRATPDPTARSVGQRIRELRGERQLTAERLAFESELGSKGFLSDIEQGRACPSINTLQVIADYLEVFLVDLFTFPEHSEREQLIDRTRWLTPGAVRKLLRDMPHGPARTSAVADSPERSPMPGPVKSRRYQVSTATPNKLGIAEKTVRHDPSGTKPRSGRRTPRV
jgi:transcriptional regulator with XRE-family HTH domain